MAIFTAGNAELEKGRRLQELCIADDQLKRQRAPGRTREEIGAGEAIRTLDPNLGKVVLYP